MYDQNPSNSFFRLLLGFLTFISFSFVITLAVSSYTLAKDAEEQAAAAFEAMIQ